MFITYFIWNLKIGIIRFDTIQILSNYNDIPFQSIFKIPIYCGLRIYRYNILLTAEVFCGMLTITLIEITLKIVFKEDPCARF
jgi:hypothetical protein